jgi:hypothetical protein
VSVGDSALGKSILLARADETATEAELRDSELSVEGLQESMNTEIVSRRGPAAAEGLVSVWAVAVAMAAGGDGGGR